MSYVGSYMWKLRQKAGDMRILTATVDILPVNPQGKIKLVYSSVFNCWSCVGGHVEHGDSWSSAACKELEEEAGITAKESDLVPFAAISGPERIFHYQDGDTQPFTLCFIIEKWEHEGQQTDIEEVPTNGWFNLEDALKMPITPWAKNILLGYQRYRDTSQFQMIEDKR